MRGYLPRGNLLDAETFRRRHLLLCWILALHIPALFAFGVWRGFGAAHAAVEVAGPAALLVFARLSQRRRRLAAFFVSAGLVSCSYVLVHLAAGSIEAHFHFFILIGLIALYQDWVPFLCNALLIVLSHGIGGTISPDTTYDHFAAQNRPWVWAGIHGVAVLAACIGVLLFWRSTELEQLRNSALATELATAELSAAQAEAARRQSMSQLLVNLARRNQSLLDRQLRLIADLEQREVEPDALANLFQLDHVATRIRRNAESLLVLSGDEPPRRWGLPVPLAEVVRAAAAEVEDYQRVEVLVNEHLEVSGRAVADLAHLLAELIENATMFSPPSSDVRVRSHLAPADPPTYLLSVEDSGIGMTEADRQVANQILSATGDTGLLGSRLGLHVVSRLALRYGLQVHLAETPGGGVTALVSMPDGLVSVGPGYSAPAPELDPVGAYPPPPPPPLPPPGSPPGLATEAPAWTVSAAELLASSTVAGADAGGRRPPAGLRITGRHIAPPAPPTLSPPEPVVARRFAEPPAPSEPQPDPTEPHPDPTAGGLVRRVPGEALATIRDQSPDPPSTDPHAAAAAPAAGIDGRDGAGPDGTDSDGAETLPPGVASDDDRTRARARVSAMLSRFQASQRAGRAQSEAHAAPDAEATAGEDQP